MFLKKMSAKQDEKSIFALDCLNFGVGLNLKSHSNQEIQINKAMKINLINKIKLAYMVKFVSKLNIGEGEK